MKRLAKVLLVILILAGSAWYWFKTVYPFKDFNRRGEIEFPHGTRIIEYHNSGSQITQGKFQIPKSEISNFIKENNLSDGGYVGSDAMVAGKCIHGGNISVQLSLSKESNILDIEIFTADPGEKTCTPN